MADKLFFKAELQTDEDDNKFYVINGTNIPKSKTVFFAEDDGDDIFCLVTNDKDFVNSAYDTDDFLGSGNPFDMVMRNMLKLEKRGTKLKELKYVIGAHWIENIAGEDVQRFGNVHDWENAGELEPVKFGPFRKILGVDYD